MHCFPVILAAALCCGADHEPDKKPAVLLEGLGSLRHPVSTKSEEAQRFFDQGLSLLYAFNHDEAARSFRRAAELDEKLAMAWWGLALVQGPNYNMAQIDPAQAKAAYEALQKALKLAEGAPAHERAYIEALAERYSVDPKADGKKLLAAYAKAMGRLAERYPDDLDAVTLHAESLMNLRPWKLWTPEEGGGGTEEIVRLLESVLRRDPDHLGANHYYIHAVEASRHPERALPSAARLGRLAPAAGHLVHMPAHIYMRVGDYEAAATANEKAIAADLAYLKRTGAKGVYPMMYLSHNIHFLAIARATQGRFTDAKKAADQLAAHVGPHIEEMPMLEAFLPTPTLILVRFGRWDEVLALPKPAEKLRVVTALWHFARGMARAGREEMAEAKTEHEAFVKARDSVPADAPYSEWNTARSILDIAELALSARIAAAGKDLAGAVDLLKKAVRAEDALHYGEPPDWFLHTRETLGAVLLRQRDAAGAEKVFRADLERHRRSGRSLFGLAVSLEAQKKDYAAQMIRLEFERAWGGKGKALRLEEP
ncbi:MAG: hypothetical protein U0793_15205 [Gemmataceae bacterium]